MKKFLLLLVCVTVAISGTGSAPTRDCKINNAALLELASLKQLIAELTTVVEQIIGGPIPSNEPFIITDVEIDITWKEVTLTWTKPEGVIAYTAVLQSSSGDESVALSGEDTSFIATDIVVGQNYTIQITPFTGDGPGETYITETFIPECPSFCTYDYTPVCGTNAITYSNPCELEIAQCRNTDPDTDITLAGEGPCEPFIITEVEIDITWKEVTLTWTKPEGVIGYTAKLQSSSGDGPLVRLSPFETSFSTTDIVVGTNYTVQITPIKADGPGKSYTSDSFIPECPEICALIFAPVCGTDGITYSNPCLLEIAQCNSGPDIDIILSSEGPCDPCILVVCDAPICEGGWVVAETVAEGECCIGCVDPCLDIACDAPICEGGLVVAEAVAEGECCIGCVDPCADIACDAPICEGGLVVAEAAAEGECCIGCVDPCADTQCDAPDCPLGFIAAETLSEGECCIGCIPIIFSDCGSVQDSGGITESGTYMVQPVGTLEPFNIYCDLVTDGGKWNVILRRDGTGGNFYRDYADYVAGFGDVAGSFWLGLENFYQLNKRGDIQLRVDMTDITGTSVYTQYSHFTLNSGETDYTLERASAVSGTGGNAFFHNKGAPFSARDRDNDDIEGSCAEDLVGGWWYTGVLCSKCNLMGEYLEFKDFRHGKGIFWAPFRGRKSSLSFVEMKIRIPQ